jgi:AcrR family transcriptional regulator
VQRYLDAALELMNEGGSGKDFTVQEVVERSGQSLRTFYQYFAGKYELLLALFDESIEGAAAHLEDIVTTHDDPLARLHAFCTEYYRMCRASAPGEPPAGPAPALVEFGQQLLTSHPKEAAHAFAPLVALFGRLLEEAEVAGALRPGLDRPRITGVVLQATMFNAFAATISASPVGEGDEILWDLLVHGITP